MEFLKQIGNWNNHRPLLLLALQNTKGNVLELGMGDGSTPYLHEYCDTNNRKLYSMDNNIEYYERFKGLQNKAHQITCVQWGETLFDKIKTIGVALIDHAPAEQRHIDAILLKDKADIIIVHDAEHEGMECDVYYIKKITEQFKYRLDLKISQHAAKTIMLSNKIDVSKLTIPAFELI